MVAFSGPPLIERLRFLRNADPNNYSTVLQMLKQHLDDVTVAVTEAPPDQILVAQGRAQEARKILQFFVDALEDPPRPPQTRPAP